jgi:phosphonate transport system substrate-binding protein
MPEIITPRRRSSHPLLVSLVILLPAAAILGGLYFFLVYKPMQQNRVENEQLMARIVGLSRSPVGHRLATQYTDADGDLIADAPKDPAKLLNPDTLVFSWIPEENTPALKDSFKDLIDRLAQATGKKVVYALEIKTPEDQLRALRDGKLHITAFSTGAVPIAVDVAGFVPVGMLASESGNAKHQLQIIVPADSSMQTLADLKDHELALTDPTSNSGYKAPIVLLKNEAGLTLETDYRIRNTLSYDNSIAGIVKKQYEAAAVASDVLDRAVASGKIKKTDYKVIFKSADFPSAAIGHAHNLKPELATKIKDALLSFKFTGTSAQAHFASSNQTQFVPVNYKNDWALVRLIDDTLGQSHQIK